MKIIVTSTDVWIEPPKWHARRACEHVKWCKDLIEIMKKHYETPVKQIIIKGV